MCAAATLALNGSCYVERPEDRPPLNRWLCEPCYEVYDALGLIVGLAVEPQIFNPRSRGVPLRIRGRDR